MSRMSDYIAWIVDKFKDTPEAYDILTKYVTEHKDELGPEYSEEKFLEHEQMIHNDIWGKLNKIKFGE